ncbi:Legumain-1 [Fasciola gigantica]|uniref:Legumain-1 n=1 Tax=Fasciola gigantica TaxID=46835 RepID=A0A504YD58_FASGI|nr:Legumain-1 [Fasciola gigantica]
MKEARRFNKLVIYMEACYSGSMFENILPSNISVFTMTASNPTESSWAALCADPEIDTCLGNEFTHQWMTDTEKRKVNKWTLGEQYSTVKSAVKNSHVSKYGDLTMTLLPIGEFQGSGSNARSLGNSEASWSTALDRSMSSHAHLVSLMHQLKRSNSLRQRELAQQHLHRALQLSKFAKDTVDEVVEEVISQAEPNGKPSDVHKHLECFRKVYEQYELKCFSIQQVSY